MFCHFGRNPLVFTLHHVQHQKSLLRMCVGRRVFRHCGTNHNFCASIFVPVILFIHLKYFNAFIMLLAQHTGYVCGFVLRCHNNNNNSLNVHAPSPPAHALIRNVEIARLEDYIRVGRVGLPLSASFGPSSAHVLKAMLAAKAPPPQKPSGVCTWAVLPVLICDRECVAFGLCDCVRRSISSPSGDSSVIHLVVMCTLSAHRDFS